MCKVHLLFEHCLEKDFKNIVITIVIIMFCKGLFQDKDSHVCLHIMLFIVLLFTSIRHFMN